MHEMHAAKAEPSIRSGDGSGRLLTHPESQAEKGELWFWASFACVVTG